MKQALLVLSIFILSISNVLACDVNIKIKQIHGLQVENKELNKVTSMSLLDKGYSASNTPVKYMAKIIISKGRDVHVLDKFFAKASISLYKAGQMQNYTHGQGKIYDMRYPAYSIDMYRLAIQTAIGHLPECLNSN